MNTIKIEHTRNNFRELDFYEEDQDKYDIFNAAWDYLQKTYPEAELIASDVYVIMVCTAEQEHFNTCIGRTIDTNTPAFYNYNTDEVVIFTDFESVEVA